MSTGFLKHICSDTPAEAAASFIIFSPEKSKRLKYVCDFIFRDSLAVNYEICSDEAVFSSSPLFKINYSEWDFAGSFTIKPDGLLGKSGVPEIPVAEKKNNLLYFFGKQDGDLHFDVFSAVFLVLSRVEEWHNFNKDKHGRFELKESIFYKNGFHLRPVVDLWVEELKSELLKFFEMLFFPEKKFRAIASIDVDNLYAYLHKGFLRTLGAGLRDLLKLDFSNLLRRNRAIKGAEKDPFDIYEEFSFFCRENQIPLIYFFLFNTGNEFDRTVHPSSPAFKKVLDEIAKQDAKTGLHPGYFTFDDENEMTKQIKAFSKFGPVKYSRQHFLRFDIQKTPYLLMKNGVEADFSMGFASGAGFRAGTTLPFYFYDFKKEEGAPLLFVPFCAMDGAYFIYNATSPGKALDELLSLKNEIKKLRGNFITVFHERTFAGHLYPGYADLYKKILLD